jgi:hypothetical protein
MILHKNQRQYKLAQPKRQLDAVKTKKFPQQFFLNLLDTVRGWIKKIT